MILLTLIKKEIIQFFRNKTDVITMLIFPVILIFVMGKSLNGLMSMDKNIFSGKTIYYNIENDGGKNNNVQVFYDFITEFQKTSDIKFVQSNNIEKVTQLVNENEESTESKVFRNLYEQYMKKYIFIHYIAKTDSTKVSKILSSKNNTEIKLEGIGYDEVNSFTYYTFVELTLIILYISTITSISMYKEKFLHTMTRLRVSNIKKINIIISKIALGIIIGIMQILIVYICSTRLFDVDWGENTTYILLVLISFIIFSSVLGIFMYMVFDDQKTAYTFSNMLIIVMGFLGGSYVPLCLVKSARITSFLCQLMPNYWVNISLLGLNYNIDTPYYKMVIVISLGASVLMIILGNIILKLKEGGSVD